MLLTRRGLAVLIPNLIGVHKMDDIEEIEAIIEDAIAELYRGFFRLRKAGAYQVEYDNMGALLMMLQQDRMNLRNQHGVID